MAHHMFIKEITFKEEKRNYHHHKTAGLLSNHHLGIYFQSIT